MGCIRLSDSIVALVILVFIIVAFSTQKIPIAVTALLGGLAMMIFGIIEPVDVVSGFGSDTVMMVAGVIVIGNALFETGLATHVGAMILRYKAAAKNEKIFLLIVLCIVTLLSAVMSNTATVAIFMPLIASVAAASKGIITKKNTYMAVGIASVLGGNLTLAGSTPQMIAQSILATTDGVREMTFFEMLKGSLPLVIVMLLYYATFGYSLQKRVFTFPEESEYTGDQLELSVEKKFSKKIISLLILIFAIVGFCSGIFSMGTIALLGACLCVLTGCISIRRVYETMDWSTLIVLGGAMGFSTGLSESGAVALIAGKIVDIFGQMEGAGFITFALLIVLAAILTNFMSNTATVSIILPIGLSVATMMDLDPITVTIGIVIGCNLSFSTPIATPPLTMTLVAGYRFTDYVKAGGPLNILLLIVAVVTLPLIYGL